MHSSRFTSERTAECSPTIVMLAADEGNLNIGDQAMYINACRRLRRLLPDCRLVAVGKQLENSVDVEDVERVSLGHRCFDTEAGVLFRLLARLPKGQRIAMLVRLAVLVAASGLHRFGAIRRVLSKDWMSTVDLIARAGLVLSCGGGYLNSLWWEFDLWPKSAMYRAAAKLGVPLVLSGQGIGPIGSRLDRLVLGLGLRSADLISLRERGEGEDYVLGLGVDPSRVLVVGDDATDLPVCSEARLRDIVREEGIDLGAPIVVAQFRATSYTKSYVDEYRFFAKLLDRVLLETDPNSKVVFVPFCYDEAGGADDRTAAFNVIKHMGHRDRATIVMGHYRPEEIKALVGLGRCALGVSYHFAVFALSQAVPCFTVYGNEYYHLKFDGLYGHYGGVKWGFGIEEGSINALCRTWRGVSGNYEDVQESLRVNTIRIVQRVESSYRRMCDIAGFESVDVLSDRASAAGIGGSSYVQ